MADLKISNLDAQEGGESLVSNIMLSISDGEILLVTGDNASGKDHLVRAILGYLPVAAGTITADDTELQTLPPTKRKIIRIGRNWGLFDHLNVKSNLEFGLHFMKMKKEDIAETGERFLKKINLAEKANLFPCNLSDEEKLKLAIARAAIINCNGIIMEHPFEDYDASQRKKLVDVLNFCRDCFGFPTIFVTDHPLDVMGISSKIAVMKNGFLEQFGETREVYNNPSSTLVATATGEINIINAQVVMGGDFYMFSTKLGGLNLKTKEKLRVETNVEILIRPEHTKLVPLGKTADARNVFSGKIQQIQYAGGFQFVEVKTEAERPFLSVQNAEFNFKVGDDIDVILMRDEYPIVKK
jgi:ABC-type sugar transport system ATPase subunit